MPAEVSPSFEEARQLFPKAGPPFGRRAVHAMGLDDQHAHLKLAGPSETRSDVCGLKNAGRKRNLA
jgi:hypothetical protein